MRDTLAIWAPVIVANLKQVHKAREQVVYQLDQPMNSLQDLKIKVKKAEAHIYGNKVEVRFKLDLLFLLQDRAGKMQLVSKQEKLVQRISLQEFTQLLSQPDPNFAVILKKVDGEGQIQGLELRAGYFLDYMVLALDQQVVQLAIGESADVETDSPPELNPDVQEELYRLTEEKEELLRKLFFYERDISSLKRGLYKVENRNAALNREISRYQQLAEQLQQALAEKDSQLNRLTNDNNYSYWRNQEPAPDAGGTSLRGRLWRILMQSL